MNHCLTLKYGSNPSGVLFYNTDIFQSIPQVYMQQQTAGINSDQIKYDLEGLIKLVL